MPNRKAGVALVATVAVVLGSVPASAEEGDGAENVDEVADAATAGGTACRSACAVSYAAACLRVQQLCAGATVVTIGGAAVPCATASAAVCLTSAALAVVCADQCPT